MRKIIFAAAFIGLVIGILSGSQELILIAIGLGILAVILGSTAMLQVETTAEIAGKRYAFKAKHPAGIEALEFEEKQNAKMKLIFEVGLPVDDHMTSYVTSLTIDVNSGLIVESQFVSVVRQLNHGKTYEISYLEKKGFVLREK